MAKTICLGQEFDPALRDTLRTVLEEYGVTGEERWWAVGVPGHEARAELIAAGQVLLLESDTYAGLTLTGDAPSVERIATRVRERLLERSWAAG